MEYHPVVRASNWLKPAAIGNRVASPIDAFAAPAVVSREEVVGRIAALG